MKIGEVTKNSCFTLLGESMRLLHEAEHTNEDFLKKCLVTSSILTIVYCLEAAANSALDALQDRVNERDYGILEKFCLVLERNTGKKVDKGCAEYQAIRRLIELRHENVHPKIYSKEITYHSEKSEGGYSWVHREIGINNSKGRGIQNISLESGMWSLDQARLAIQAVVKFLNVYVCDWWGLDQSVRDYIFLPQSDVARHGDTAMHDIDTLRMLKTYEDIIEVKFVNIPLLPEDHT